MYCKPSGIWRTAHELSCDYQVTDNTLTLEFSYSDLPEGLPETARFSRVRDGDVHVLTMNEVDLDSLSLGMFGEKTDTKGAVTVT